MSGPITKSPSIAGFRGAWWALPAILAALVHANTLAGGFVYDDPIILQWLDSRPWDLAGAFGSTRTTTYAVHSMDRMLWGDWPVGWHATNIFLHATVCGLCAPAARALGASPRAALIGALIFAVHPVHVEVVANVTNRKDMVAAIPALLALILWRRDPRTGKNLALITLLFALALYGKEVAVATLPLALLLADSWLGSPLGRRGRKIQNRLFLAFLLAAGVALAPTLRDLLQPAAIADNVDGAYETFQASLATAFANFLHVPRLLFFPARLQIDYAIEPAHSFFDPRALLGLLVGLLWIAAAFALKRRAPVAAFGLAWVLLLFIPTSNLLPLHHIIVAERYLYLPSFGLCLAAGCALHSALGSRASLLAVLTPLLVLGGARSFVRNQDWKDLEALVVAGERDGVNTWRLKKSGGGWAARSGDLELAATRYEEAAALRPQDPELWYWAGAARYAIDDIELAEQHFRKSAGLLKDHLVSEYGIAMVMLRTDRLLDAVEALTLCIRISPEFAPAHYNLAVAYTLLGRKDLAYDHALSAVKADPSNADAHQRLGILLAEQGRFDPAYQALAQALELDGTSKLTLQSIAEVAAVLGRPGESVTHLMALHHLDPDDPEVLENLAGVQLMLGETASARAYLEAAIERGAGPDAARRLDELRAAEESATRR